MLIDLWDERNKILSSDVSYSEILERTYRKIIICAGTCLPGIFHTKNSIPSLLSSPFLCFKLFKFNVVNLHYSVY